MLDVSVNKINESDQFVLLHVIARTYHENLAMFKDV
jgi:hypothetical protein